MEFSKSAADLFIPDSCPEEEALARTTHLAIMAHQDDIEIAAYHGIAECFGQNDQWFTGVVVTNGAGSARTGIYADYTDEEMQKTRQLEQRKAAFVGEYSAQVQLLHSSGEIKDAQNCDVVKDLVKLLQAARPQVLYLHNPADKHETHVATLLRAITALRSLPRNQRPEKVYGCEVWRSLDWLLDSDKQVLPSGTRDNLAACLTGVFDSQVSGGKRYDLATAGRRLANATFFESHCCDKESALAWAVDLTPLMEDDNLGVAEFITQFIDRFRQDVAGRIKSLTGE